MSEPQEPRPRRSPAAPTSPSRRSPTSTATSSPRCGRRATLYFAWMCVVGADPHVRHPGLDVPDLLRHGRGRQAHAADVGDVHHHLRVLDRYRPRRHADLGRALPVPGPLAHVDLPGGRGDDDLRRAHRRPVPADPRRPDVVRLLPAAVPEPALPLAQLQVAAGVGRVRDLHVPVDQHRVLHRGAGARHRRAAGRLHRLAAAGVRDAGARLGGLGPAVAPLPARLRPVRRAGHAARAVRAQRGVVGLRDGARPRLALDAVRAVLRRRRHLLGLRHGAGAGAAHAALLPPARLHPRSPPGHHGQAHPGHRPGADLLLHLRAVHLLVQRRPLREGLAVLAADRDVLVGAVHRCTSATAWPR